MGMQDKMEDVLQTKLMVFGEKYVEARNKFLEKQLEIIKKYDPSYESSVQDFFTAHTIASRTTYYEKKYYDVVAHRYVNYDLVEDNIGIMYDELGKTVHKESKRTKEFIVLEYYSKIIFALMDLLNKVETLEKNNTEELGNSPYPDAVVEETPPQGPKF